MALRARPSAQLDEVDEARKVVETLAEDLRKHGVEVKTFHDDSSTCKSTNLHTSSTHNKQTRDLDMCVHLTLIIRPRRWERNASMCRQSTLQAKSPRNFKIGFINRGAKKRTDLYFLNNTKMPAILIETCFVDITADSNLINAKYEAICNAVAAVLSGGKSS